MQNANINEKKIATLCQKKAENKIQDENMYKYE